MPPPGTLLAIELELATGLEKPGALGTGRPEALLTAGAAPLVLVEVDAPFI